MPRALGRLGVAEAELRAPYRLGHRHRRCRPPVGGRARRHAGAAELFAPGHRLQPHAGPETSIPEISELTPIPGNVGLSEAERPRARARFSGPITIGSKPSSTAGGKPAGRGADRDAQLYAGLQGRGAALACRRALQSRSAFRPSPHGAAERGKGLIVGDNEPYSVTDATDYTIPVHGERRGLHHVLIEIRQDLIADEDGQRDWALRLARLLPLAYRDL